MYFEAMPKILYDSTGGGEFNIVTNLLKRIAVKSKVSSNAVMYDTYDIVEGQRPEEIAYLMWGDAELHWIILLMNNITDVYHDWPLSTPNFLRFINDKYSNPDAIHHWEITQTSGVTTTKISVGGEYTTYSATTTYQPNGIYVEYSNNLYTPSQTTLGNLPTDVTYWSQLIATAITNMEYLPLFLLFIHFGCIIIQYLN